MHLGKADFVCPYIYNKTDYIEKKGTERGNTLGFEDLVRLKYSKFWRREALQSI